jgi:precorrin-2 dehydrogenase/sirohydrochlorin ferrochelatase
MKSETFPVGLRLAGRRALVVGDGAAAEQRTTALLDAGATVRVVSKRPTETLRTLGARSAIELRERAFEDADVEECLLVVLSDVDAALGARLDAIAAAERILFCAVDQPAYGNFSHLAVARQGDVTVSISTNGRAPALARRLREELMRLLSDSTIGAFVDTLSALREKTPSADRAKVLGEAVRGLRITGKLEIPE